MKIYVRNVGLVILFFTMAFCWPANKRVPLSDARIDILKDSLPANWKMELTDTIIVIRCSDSVYRIWTNHINEPHMHGKTITEVERMEKFRMEGKKKEPAFFRFKLVPRWTDAQVKKSSAHNQKIYKQISALPKKYKIEHLYDHFASHKGDASYTAKAEKDKKQIALYETEKAKLESAIIIFPNYCTDRYSVFSGKKVGMNSEYEDIYPERISEQAYHILGLLNEYWDCNK